MSKKKGDRNIDPGGGRRAASQTHKSPKDYNRARQKEIIQEALESWQPKKDWIEEE